MTPRSAEAKTEQTYDTLDLLLPATRNVAVGAQEDCRAVGEGKLVPTLRFAATGRERDW